MDRKKELRDELKSLINQIKTNSKDVHFADKLIADLLSVKGQLMIEPTELDCGTKTDEWEGETYRVTLTNRGALYHEKGGYSIFVTPSMKSLYDTLADIVINKDKYAALEGEERESYETALSAVAYCLALPKFVFTDGDFTYKVATMVVEFIKNEYDRLMNEELQEETVKEDREWKEGVDAMNAVKEMFIEDKTI
jgi:hypothetical protein